jgi:choline dehydrogenase-like flavoprotein
MTTATVDRQYDFIVVGAGAAGSVLAAELSASGAQVLVIESGGPDDAPTIANPSIWFYNVGGPLDYHLPVNPSPRLNNRKFNMALGHVLGGGTSINAMVWMRGMERDYDGWAKNGARGWAFADVLPVFKRQEDWEGGANTWRGAGGPISQSTPGVHTGNSTKARTLASRSSTRWASSRAVSSEGLLVICFDECIGTRPSLPATQCSACCATWRESIRCCTEQTFRICAETSPSDRDSDSCRAMR